MEEIVQLIKKILAFLDLEDANVEVIETGENDLSVNIRTENGRFLIGPDGSLLKDFEHLIRMVAQKQNYLKRINLDINNYRREREQYLKKIAKETARKVIVTKKPIKLPPMNAYERRIIHMELAINPNVTTESVGEEPNRCLVIKPYP
ncbi:MAG TPA: R3H domain-containing nucleic acid-binding protein [Candidatus Paceibacterota bacterium]|nr:R3H domain-containing nucleic acid-binding protein [Candidatus Paceibacterota bacterium]HOL53901.1 R3H domain-containing nucleic acid-binding protein [Candidatus Paceibacterota bacterium]HON21681.1 R3H domain-containing nucleic acid-binding protein [Candidatus Paceibacterota bacterium]HPP17190.1 R3H domain-containing nucleic acid-binding protein [Candidatus Paceibacterota bacterium]HRU33666.1 R3H domain-containing nucleic acid-binding protein [Candidatus Paceibacterota bacterium]